ncbi:hypothetical protein MMC26_005888 [Xylographa opegraphella]|nr:hypothetical protein [Xylographa opegraphella]
MVHRKGVRVEIISQGKCLPIYTDPAPDNSAIQCERHAYVEAVTGVRFSVKVTLTDRFLMCDGDGVEVHLAYDGGEPRVVFCQQEYFFLCHRNHSFDFGEYPQYDIQSQQWKHPEFIFQDLHLQDSTSTTPLLAETVKKLGSIEVTVKRVKRDRRVFTCPENYTQQSGGLDQVSETLLKGKAISNTIKSVAGPSCAAPLENPWCFASLPGQPGLPIKFHILYRSRKALQMLGYIPRTPSPQPLIRNVVSTSRLSNASPATPPVLSTNVLTDLLPGSIALLERSLAIRAEPIIPTSHASTGTTVKRERDAKENEREYKRRKVVKIEVLDMTAD